MFRVVLPPIIRSAYNCIYSIWYLSHRYCYLPLSWKSWNWFECAVDTVVCAPDDGWKYHPKHVEQFPDIDKLCNVTSCWIYIGILLRAQYILHISRIRVNQLIRGGFFPWELNIRDARLTTHFYQVLKLKVCGAMPPLLPYVCKACCLIKPDTEWCIIANTN